MTAEETKLMEAYRETIAKLESKVSEITTLNETLLTESKDLKEKLTTTEETNKVNGERIKLYEGLFGNTPMDKKDKVVEDPNEEPMDKIEIKMEEI